RAVPRLALPHRLRQLTFAEQLLLATELLVLAMQLDEDGDLRAEHLRIERLRQVVDGAARVAAEDVLLVRRDRGQENDRDRACLLALLDQGRGLEAEKTRSRSEEHTSELQSRFDLVCRLLLEKKKEAVLALLRPRARLRGPDG